MPSNSRELKFSKSKQTGNNVISKEDFKAIYDNEAALQRKCEAYLDWMHIGYIRIPDALYRIIFGALSNVTPSLRSLISSFIKGLPDLTILFPDGRYLCVELKTKKGKMSQGQKTFAKKVPQVVIVRSLEDFKELVDNFKSGGAGGRSVAGENEAR